MVGYDDFIMCYCEKCIFRDLIYCTHDEHQITPNSLFCKYYEEVK